MCCSNRFGCISPQIFFNCVVARCVANINLYDGFFLFAGFRTSVPPFFNFGRVVNIRLLRSPKKHHQKKKKTGTTPKSYGLWNEYHIIWDFHLWTKLYHTLVPKISPFFPVILSLVL